MAVALKEWDDSNWHIDGPVEKVIYLKKNTHAVAMFLRKYLRKELSK
jgi:hypothetical protein